MIAERFPNLMELKPDEQLELASELAREALKSQQAPELSNGAVELLEKRLDAYLEQPEIGTTWEDLKNRRDA